jgi:hypothetical protein
MLWICYYVLAECEWACIWAQLTKMRWICTELRSQCANIRWYCGKGAAAMCGDAGGNVQRCFGNLLGDTTEISRRCEKCGNAVAMFIVALAQCANMQWPHAKMPWQCEKTRCLCRAAVPRGTRMGRPVIKDMYSVYAWECSGYSN